MFAWFAARAVTGQPPGLGLGDDVRITSVGSETGLPLDDVGAALSNGGFVLVQAKAGMRQLARNAADLRQAADQVVAALIDGIRTTSGARTVEAGRDRLVIATNQDGSQAFDDLGKVCEVFPGPPVHLPIDVAAPTLAQKRALSTFLLTIQDAWSAAMGREPAEAEIRRLLDVLQVVRLDFRERDGVDLLRTAQLLSGCAATPLVDRPLAALIEIGRATIREQRWQTSEQLRAAVRQRHRSATVREPRDWLRALPRAYVGRSGPEIAELESAGAQTVTVITGAAGCGKTVLAVRVARDLAVRCPDGQLMIDMRGFDDKAPMSTGEAVDLLLHQVGAFVSDREETSEARRLRLLKILKDGRFVVVLDNVADSRSVLPLLPHGDASKIIVTSRRMLATLARERGVGSVEIGLLTDAEAAGLFTALVGPERVAAEPDATRRLVAACGNLPLAISIAAAQIAQMPGQRLARIAIGLTAADDRLDFLDLGEPESSIRSVFSWSYILLTEEQRRTYLLVGAAPGPDLDLAGTCALLGSSQAHGLLRALRRRGLMQENADGTFAMHTLLRDFATSLVGLGHLPEQAMSEAHSRLLQHYVRMLKEPEGGDRWLEINLDRALAAIRHGTGGRHKAAVQEIADALIDPLWYRGRFDDAVSLLRSVIDGIDPMDTAVMRAYFLRLLAISLRRAGSPDDSVKCAQKALRLLEQEAPNESGRARADCHYIIGVAMATEGDHEAALGYLRPALAGFETHGTESDVGDALNSIGWSLAMVGEPEQALIQCRRAAVLHERVGTARSLAADLDSIGYIHRLMGNHSAAREQFERCLNIYRESGYKPHEARTLEELGDTAASSDEFLKASLYWTQAEELLTALGHDLTTIQAKLRTANR
ncbi:tetratricopeptide repeat protein [Actinomadura rubrisoli]|uniref:tetratricopeptide repeat protein n=1 Tax=Actinomadura rubrisoli TaxID=2530368 RepID=UPI0014052574|nr:tetratricopeptide repeat protein [Actinomadura rubrisoli]